MDLEITPYTGIGPIRLGMSREEVRRAVGTAFEVDSSCESPDVARDIFLDEGIFVDYQDTPLECMFVQVRRPANPIIHGRELFSMSFNNIYTWLTDADPRTILKNYRVTSLAFGLGVYVPEYDLDPREPPAAAFVFNREWF